MEVMKYGEEGIKETRVDCGKRSRIEDACSKQDAGRENRTQIETV
jgi:hypothetical protein